MPIYEYVCHHCGHRFDVVHGLHGEGPAQCPVCQDGPVRKAFAPPAIHFKGSGWAKKDRSTSSASAGRSSGKDKEAPSGSEAPSPTPPPGATPPASGAVAAGGD